MTRKGNVDDISREIASSSSREIASSSRDDTQLVAVVTGAARGLGRATAERLAEQHRRLVLVDVLGPMVESLAANLEARHGCHVLPIVRDLGDASACESIVPLALERFGQVDILVNAASILSRRPLDQVTTDDFDRTFHVNARAPFLLSRAAMQDMISRKWGRIINVTATSVYTGGFNETSAMYDGTKGAVAVFTKAFARYGAEFGVLVNTVCPGPIRTSMLLDETTPDIVQEVVNRTPLGRMADPAEVANIICWLASDESSFATGATFNINGGLVMHS